MKKFFIGIFIGVCLMISCSSSNYKSFNECSSNDSVFISQVIKNSNFKLVKLTDYENISFYKVYVTSKSHNGDYINELLVTKYYGYGISVIELSSYCSSYSDYINN